MLVSKNRIILSLTAERYVMIITALRHAITLRLDFVSGIKKAGDKSIVPSKALADYESDLKNMQKLLVDLQQHDQEIYGTEKA